MYHMLNTHAAAVGSPAAAALRSTLQATTTMIPVASMSTLVSRPALLLAHKRQPFAAALNVKLASGTHLAAPASSAGRALTLTTQTPTPASARAFHCRRGPLGDAANKPPPGDGWHKHPRHGYYYRSGPFGGVFGPRSVDPDRFEPPMRGLMKFGAAAFVGMTVFSMTKPLFFLVVGGALGYGSYRVVRAYLDVKFPPYYRPMSGGGSSSNASSSADGAKPSHSDIGVNDPMLVWIQRDLGVRPPSGSAPRYTPDDAKAWIETMAGPFRQGILEFAQRVSQPTTQLRKMTIAHLTADNSQFKLPKSFEFAPIRFALQRGAVDSLTGRSGSVEIEFDVLDKENGTLIPVKAFGEVDRDRVSSSTGGLVVRWIEVGNGPRVSVNAGFPKYDEQSGKRPDVVEGKATDVTPPGSRK